MAKQLSYKSPFNKKVQFFVCEAESLDFLKNSSFTLVVSEGVFPHLEKEPALKEIYRILGPGGRAILGMAALKDGVYCKSNILPEGWQINSEGLLSERLYVSEWENLFKKNGFEINFCVDLSIQIKDFFLGQITFKDNWCYVLWKLTKK
jgi:SAM-dependent methyltransferase